MSKDSWIDNLDDKEIQRLFSQKAKYKEINQFLDNKLLNTIHDKDKIITERKKLNFIRNSRYAFSFVVLFIFIFLSYFYFIRNFIIPVYNKSLIIELNGEAYIKNKIGKIKEIKDVPFKVKQSNTIIVKKDSNLKIEIGSNSIVQLNQLSELKINKLVKKKDIEKTNFSVNLGNVNFFPGLPNINSTFEVETELITINVTGTEFLVNVDNDKNTRVFVKEGSIFIKPKINTVYLEKIKEIDQGLNEKIENIIFSKIKLNKDQSLEVLYSDFKDIESQIIDIINGLYNKLEKNKYSKEKINKIIEQSNNDLKLIINLKNKLIMSDNKKEVSKEKFSITKLQSNPGINLTEKNTYLTNDNNYLYISSDSNNAIYSTNTLKGTINWAYKDPNIKDITSAIIPFKDKLVLGTSNSIIILDKNGKLILKKSLNNGVTYWAKSIIAKDKVYIPTNKYIYYYDGEKIEILNNFLESSGQLYISYNKDKLFCFDSNELNIKIFDLLNNKIIWTSSKLKDRAFIEPIIINDIIYITDIKNNFYKFDYIKTNTPQITKIGTGNLTNIINYNKKLYFIGINGYFYELKNNSVKKIIKVDNQPDINKYLTKRLVKYKNHIFFCSDTGNIFYYDILNNEPGLLSIPQNSKKLPLIGTPLIINNKIYFIDTGSNIYTMGVNL